MVGGIASFARICSIANFESCSAAAVAANCRRLLATAYSTGTDRAAAASLQGRERGR